MGTAPTQVGQAQPLQYRGCGGAGAVEGIGCLLWHTTSGTGGHPGTACPTVGVHVAGGHSPDAAGVGASGMPDGRSPCGSYPVHTGASWPCAWDECSTAAGTGAAPGHVLQVAQTQTGGVHAGIVGIGLAA